MFWKEVSHDCYIWERFNDIKMGFVFRVEFYDNEHLILCEECFVGTCAHALEKGMDDITRTDNETRH